MVNQFFIIVDKRDSEKFRKFKIGQFNDSTKEILKENQSRFVWGLHKGNVVKSIWSEMKKGDIIFLTIPKNNFQIYGKVSTRTINSNLGKRMWPDDLNSSQIDHFIFFNELKNINLSYNELTGYSTLNTILPISGIYRIDKLQYKTILNKMDNVISNSKIKKRPKSFVPPKFTNGPPKKNKSEVYRFLRDTTLVKQLKEFYKNKCQICDFTFEYEKNKFYSEVHHYNPLEEGGNDDRDNMIVVCPNHHSEFDYKIIAIDNDGTSIIDRNGNKIGKIKFHMNHKLSITNIKSQLEV